MWRDSESDQDFLNFTEVAEQIATLVTSANLLPISVGVFGTWGTGKSTVLRLVESELAKACPQPIVIKFDAWLYQGFDDAKAALMEIVADRLSDEAKADELLTAKVRRFAGRINYFRALTMAADVGVGMALGVPPGLLTRAGSAIGSLLSGKPDAEAAETIKEGAKEVADAWSKLIKPEEARTPPKEIDAFRREFSQILRDLKRPLILFIDNLDRCLPDVTIGTLEAIRLFLFIEGTAFIIAADEDMVRHSVAKHFSDPTIQHVTDYLDKVIQVPMRVPRVGSEDVRAYLYSLFVSTFSPASLEKVQAHLLKALQEGWKGDKFSRDAILQLTDKSDDLVDALAVADRLAPILATAPSINGNPRIIKRLLNAVMLRQTLAKKRGMTVTLPTLAKLALFERCTDVAATQALFRLVMDEADAEQHLVPNAKLEGDRPDLPEEWKKHSDFIERWREMEPFFDSAASLQPAMFLSRDVMAPAMGRSGLSASAQEAVDALLKVTSVNSPAAKKICEALSATDRRSVMRALIAVLRERDWTQSVRGVHGVVVLAQLSPAEGDEFRAFARTLQTKSMHVATRVLLETTGFIEGSK